MKYLTISLKKNRQVFLDFFFFFFFFFQRVLKVELFFGLYMMHVDLVQANFIILTDDQSMIIRHKVTFYGAVMLQNFTNFEVLMNRCNSYNETDAL